MPRFDLTTVGEGSLRLSVPSGERLERAAALDVAIAGSEANVAGALASLGWRCGWVSRLPEGPLGRRVLAEYRAAGLDTAAVVPAPGERLAMLFVEYAAPPRATRVTFDRADSAFSRMRADEVDWDYLLDTRRLHLTGISAALSDSVRALLVEAAGRARAAGIPVSVDVNYRERLWSPEAARAALIPLIEGADPLFCSRADAERVFGCHGPPRDALLALVRVSGARRVVMSRGDDGVLAWDGERTLSSPAREVEIVDRIGAGDGLAAGVLHGLLDGDFEAGLAHGCTVAALAMSQFGEMVLTGRGELADLAERSASGIVR